MVTIVGLIICLQFVAFATEPTAAVTGDTVLLPKFVLNERRLIPTTLRNPEVSFPGLAPKEPPLQLFYPGRAYTDGEPDGHATVGVSLDEKGQPKDYMVIAYTKDYFGKALMRHAHSLEFAPLLIKGMPVPSRFQLGYFFKPDGVLLLNPTQALQRRFMTSLEPVFEYRPHHESELDQPLEFVQEALPKIPRGFQDKKPETLSIIISFYVDETGRVRLPNADLTPAPELVHNAIQAALNWRFKPPMIKGKPVLAYAAREVEFVAGPVRSELSGSQQ